MEMQCRLMNEDEKEGVNERIQALEYELNQRVHEELEVRAIVFGKRKASRPIDRVMSATTNDRTNNE